MSPRFDTDVVVIGGGQAGLAMSHQLSERSIDHVVLERGETGNSWKNERWDSLRLLSPNWMTRLPGGQYRGDDPEGFMTAAEVAALLETYAADIEAPIISNTTVLEVTPTDPGFRTETDNGVWRPRAVVIATGACSTPKIPQVADAVPDAVHQLAPIHYRNPHQVGEGRVLVVGASASGIQIADELARSGRDVTLAVGEHTRMLRTYRGMDIHWWMDQAGILDERYDDDEELARARRTPSLQLIGTPEKRTIDLNGLRASGVELTGRLAGIRDTTAQFSGGFANHCASADLKLNRLLDRFDEFATATGLADEVDGVSRPLRTQVDTPRLTMDLGSVETIVWATGFRPNYPWLDPSMLDRKGAIDHDRGVVATPGAYVLGLPHMRRRKSGTIDGVGTDAGELADHLAVHLDRSVSFA